MSGAQGAVPGQRVTALYYNQNVAGPWTAITLGAGWTNEGAATVTAQYRLSNAVTCEVIGTVVTGTVTNGTTVFTLPSGFYNPNVTQVIPAIVRGASPSMAWFNVMTNGQVQCEAFTTGITYAFHAFIALDA